MSAIFDIELQDTGLLQRDETSEDESSDVIEIDAVKHCMCVRNALAGAHVNRV